MHIFDEYDYLKKYFSERLLRKKFPKDHPFFDKNFIDNHKIALNKIFQKIEEVSNEEVCINIAKKFICKDNGVYDGSKYNSTLTELLILNHFFKNLDISSFKYEPKTNAGKNLSEYTLLEEPNDTITMFYYDFLIYAHS